MQGHHVDAEHALHRCLLVEIVQHDVADFAFTQLDYDAHAVFIGLIAQLTDAFDTLVAHELCDFLDQACFVDLVRQLRNDDCLTPLFAELLDLRARPNIDTAASRAICRIDSRGAVNDACGREIGPRKVFHQSGYIDRRIVDQDQRRGDHLIEIMRRYIRCHSNRDARGAIDEKVWQPRGHDRRLFFRSIVVLDEIDRFLVDVCKQLVRNPRHSHLGVTHRRRRISVNRSEVALSVDKHGAHGEWLCHSDDRVVDRGVAVRVVFTDHITDDAGRFLVRLVVIVTELAHGIKNTPVHRLQSVPHIGQGTSDNYAHRVVEIGLLHLLFETY